MLLSDSLEILKRVETKIGRATDKTVLNKSETVVNKNSGVHTLMALDNFEKFREISRFIDASLADITTFRYALVTSDE